MPLVITAVSFIVPQNGRNYYVNSSKYQYVSTLVKELQEILVSVGIDPIKGQEVLCWAPNGVKGQHSYKTLKKTAEDIKKAFLSTNDPKKRYEAVVQALDKNKLEAQNRKKNNLNCSKK